MADDSTQYASCPNPGVDTNGGHSWRFDGDNPYIICCSCDEMHHALTRRVIREGGEAS